MQLSEGKLRRLKGLADPQGVLAAIAVDHRACLQKPLADACGVDFEQISPERMGEFKAAVTRVLAPYASAILLDPLFGLDAARTCPAAGLMLAYEEESEKVLPGRLPELMPHVSVKRLVDWGANAVKTLMFYSPFEDAGINDIKHAFVERIGAECETYDVPFFLEFVGYDPQGGDEKGLAYAAGKPEMVRRSMEEFSKPQYRADVLKVEIPINVLYVEGSSSYQGHKAYTREEALRHFRETAAATSKPFIYLSAGVGNAQFTESLGMAAEAGADFSGVLCGRATWNDGIPVYAKRGVHALEDWLAKEGVSNIQAINEALRGATPWHQKMGIERQMAERA